MLDSKTLDQLLSAKNFKNHYDEPMGDIKDGKLKIETNEEDLGRMPASELKRVALRNMSKKRMDELKEDLGKIDNMMKLTDDEDELKQLDSLHKKRIESYNLDEEDEIE